MHSRGRRSGAAWLALAAIVVVILARAPRAASAAPVARGCDVVDEGGKWLARFPAPVTLGAPGEGGVLAVRLWDLELPWTPGTPVPARGPIFPAACGAPPDDSWQGTLVHAARAADDGEQDAAALAWEAGLAGLHASGVRGDRVFALPSPELVPAGAVRRALAAADPDRLDAALARLATTFPFLREGADAYATLAAWLRAHGRADLAHAWDARAAASANGFINDDRRAAAAVERLVPFALGAYLALPLFGLVLGLGLGARARRQPGPPGPLVLPLIGLGTLLFVALILCASLTGQLDVIAKHRDVPAALLEDGMAAPEVRTWIETRVRKPARARLLANVDAERAAMKVGKLAEVPPPSDDEMRQALAPTQGIGGRIADGAGGLHLARLMDPGRLLSRVVVPFDSLLRALLALLLAGGLGFVIGRAAPRAWRAAQVVVPGVSRWLGPIAGLVTMLTVAALVALAAGRPVVPNARPDLRPLFGLEGLPLPSVVPGVPTWVLPVLVVAIGVHVLGIWMDRRFARIGEQSSSVDKPRGAG